MTVRRGPDRPSRPAAFLNQKARTAASQVRQTYPAQRGGCHPCPGRSGLHRSTTIAPVSIPHAVEGPGPPGASGSRERRGPGTPTGRPPDHRPPPGCARPTARPAPAEPRSPWVNRARPRPRTRPHPGKGGRPAGQPWTTPAPRWRPAVRARTGRGSGPVRTGPLAPRVLAGVGERHPAGRRPVSGRDWERTSKPRRQGQAEMASRSALAVMVILRGRAFSPIGTRTLSTPWS